MKTKEFYQSDLYRIVQAMKASGNRPGVVRQWKELFELWAGEATGKDADAVRAWLPFWHVRPFYTAVELAPIFPVLSVTFGFAQRAAPAMSPNRLANLLMFADLPLLHDANHNVYQSPITGILDRYFIVERLHYWRERDTTQEEFEREFDVG